MDSNSSPGSSTDMLIDQLSLNKRIAAYKECCFRAYAYGLASLSIVTSVTYFALKTLPIRRNHLVMLSGCLGSAAGYITSKDKSRECNLILKAHRESMRNPVQPDASVLGE